MKTKPSDELLEVAQEITFARALAGNDKTLRERALRRLRKWLVSKSKSSKCFTEDGFIRLWRGLFYNVWMSDKPLVQEEVVEGVSSLVHCFTRFSDAVAFIMCFFQTLSETWFGLDSHRLDKYLMFVRRFLRQSFTLAEKHDWKKSDVVELTKAFKKAFLNAPLGLIMHICEIYLEELAKVSKGKLDKSILSEFINPFGEIMSCSSDVRLIKHIGDFIYMYLLKQSDLGIKHQIKFEVWKKLGCPEGNINVMQEVDHDSEEETFEAFEESDISLDARAGHVDVLLPPIKFDPVAITNHLTKLKKNSDTTTRARKRLMDIINKYQTFERGKYPLGIHKVDVIRHDDEEEEIEDAALELMEEELEMYKKDKPPTKRKQKKERKPLKGKWIVTPAEKKRKISSKENESHNSIILHNTWHISSVSNSPETNSVSDSANVLVRNQTINNKKRKKKVSQMSLPTNGIQTNSNEKSTVENFSNDWGNVKWDDDQQQEIEIVIEPKQRFQNNNVLPHMSSPRSRKNSSSGTPRSGKKVEFLLNRNSIQDEKDYKRCLKEKPVIKFDGDLRPPLGVLKTTPFSSPVNPFMLPTTEE